MKKHTDILQELHDLYVAKNHDYGDSFHQTYQKYGVTSLMTRLHDKFARLEALSKSEAKVKDESFRNTLVDLVNYGVMGLMEMDEEEDDDPCCDGFEYPDAVRSTIYHIRATGGTIVGVSCDALSYLFGQNGYVIPRPRYKYTIEYVHKDCPTEVLTMHINA